jgi:hypothetical protein
VGSTTNAKTSSGGRAICTVMLAMTRLYGDPAIQARDAHRGGRRITHAGKRRCWNVALASTRATALGDDEQPVHPDSRFCVADGAASHRLLIGQAWVVSTAAGTGP